MNLRVSNMKIRGEDKDGDNLYLVNWYYCANFGSYLVFAKDEEGAINESMYSKEKVTFMATRISRGDLPVVSVGTENPSFEEEY